MAETEWEVDSTTKESPLKKKPKIKKSKNAQKTAKIDAAKKGAREMFATPRYNISDSDSESEVKELKELAQLKSQLFSRTSPTRSSFGILSTPSNGSGHPETSTLCKLNLVFIEL